MNSNLFFVIGASGIALAFAFWKTSWINAQDEGTDRMKIIGKSIADGAMAFLKAEYRVLAIFVLFVAVLLGLVNNGRDDSSSLISVSSSICLFVNLFILTFVGVLLCRCWLYSSSSLYCSLILFEFFFLILCERFAWLFG